MRRIAIVLTLVAAVVGLHACAADAPDGTRSPAGGGGGIERALDPALHERRQSQGGDLHAGPGDRDPQRRPRAGRDGRQLLDGLRHLRSQNGLPLVSVVTTDGVGRHGPLRPERRARPRSGRRRRSRGKTGSAEPHDRRSSPTRRTLPFVSSCSPSFGPKEGGTSADAERRPLLRHARDHARAVHGQRRDARTAS